MDTIYTLEQRMADNARRTYVAKEAAAGSAANRSARLGQRVITRLMLRTGRR